MHKLGISVYPTQSCLEEMVHYIELSAKYGFKRVFTNLLSVKNDDEAVFQKFKSVVRVATENNMIVIADINHKVFKDLNLTSKDLSFFKSLGVSGIRVDAGFSAQEIAQMSYNQEHMFVELNISVSATFIEDVLSYKPNLNQLIGCHNFYPQTYTGLSYNRLITTSESYKKNAIKTAAFVTSQEGKIGPWKIMEGLPTLESHRNLLTTVQAKHLLMTNVIDDLLIGNAFASESELRALSEINLTMPSFDVYLSNDITSLDRKVIEKEFHFNRGDVSDYVIRSTMSRVHYKNEDFPPNSTNQIVKGDIMICNDAYGHYKGEMQIALQDMVNKGYKNVIGHVRKEEHFLLDLLEPWQPFELKVIS